MTGRHIADRYARAVFEVARSQGVVERVLDEIAFAAEAIGGSKDLLATLEGRDVDAGRLKAVVDDVFARAGASAVTRGLLAVLCENRRLPLLPQVHEAYRRRVDEHAGRVDALVLTAAPLGAAQEKALAEALAARTGRQVRLKIREDPGLLGGVRVRVGNQVLDGSARCRLRNLKKTFEQGARP